MPPRVDTAGVVGGKRKRDADDSSSDIESSHNIQPRGRGRKEKERYRRKEIVSTKALQKDLYRKPVIPNRDAAGQ